MKTESTGTVWKFLAIAALLAACTVAGAVLWFERALEPVAAGDRTGAETVHFEVEPGATMGRVAFELEAQGLIRDSRVARWFARFEDLSSKLKVGEYELSKAQSTPEILEILAKGRVQLHSVVIPEGLRAREIADRLAAAGLVDRDAFLAIVESPEAARSRGFQAQSLEGYLFPDTYRFAKGLATERVVDAMTETLRDVLSDLEAEIAAQDLSIHEIVTLASIVEKETAAPQERPLIAAVFLNRLRRGMRLETDPTVIYGIEDFDGNLRRVHLLDESNPYNTYKISALPPGPIASPGREAIEAVLRPADSPYLYFVSKNDGTHIFSKTYAEHNRNVNRYQRRGRRKR